jgi:hypothetical protein
LKSLLLQVAVVAGLVMQVEVVLVVWCITHLIRWFLLWNMT